MTKLLDVKTTSDSVKIRFLFDEEDYKKRINLILMTLMIFNITSIIYVIILNTNIFSNSKGYQQLISRLAFNIELLKELMLWILVLLLIFGNASLFVTIFGLPIEMYLFSKKNKVMVELILSPSDLILKKHNGIRLIERYLIKPEQWLGLTIRSEKNRYTMGKTLHCISLLCRSELAISIPKEYLITRFHPDEKLILSVIKKLKPLMLSFYGYTDEDLQQRWLKINPKYVKKYNVPLDDNPTSRS